MRRSSFAADAPLETKKGGAAMKLYKCMDEDSGREFLRAGEIMLDQVDDNGGWILFSPESLLQNVPSEGLMVEFEVHDYASFVPSVRPREGVRMLPVRLFDCTHIGSEYWSKLKSDFRIGAIYIAPDCQIGWRRARLCMKAMGHAQAEIKILARELLSGDNREVMVIDEWFVPGGNGLQHFKRNPNCPNIYNENVVPDVASAE